MLRHTSWVTVGFLNNFSFSEKKNILKHLKKTKVKYKSTSIGYILIFLKIQTSLDVDACW